ncbi:MAG: WXG100 family type VII secretion target [Lachnospiraceae bacterium]|nr:WXG100 family type VII secretion target [Lachnospiraceae bacterium]
MSMNTIKVSNETLINAANTIAAELKAISQSYSIIKNTVVSSQSYWQGLASQEHQSKLEEIETGYTSVMGELSKEPGNLMRIAGVYQQAEESVESMSKALPTEVLF